MIRLRGYQTVSLFLAMTIAVQAIAGSFTAKIPASADEAAHGQCTAESATSPGGNPGDCASECCVCVSTAAALQAAVPSTFSAPDREFEVSAAQSARAGPVEQPFRPPI